MKKINKKEVESHIKKIIKKYGENPSVFGEIRPYFEKNDEKYGLLSELVISHFRYGNFFEEGWNLFPLRHPFVNLQNIVDEYREDRGDFTLVLGVEGKSTTENYIRVEWKKIYSMPREYRKFFNYVFSNSTSYDDHIVLTNESIEILTEFGFNFPENKNNGKFFVWLDNIYIACMKKSIKNFPETFDFWSSDFGGHGAYIENPFLFEKQDFVSLGWLAKEVQAWNGDGTIKDIRPIEFFIKKYLEEYFERFKLDGIKITYAEGNYAGRAGCNSWNTGIGEWKEIKLKNAKDFTTFAFLGCRTKIIK